MRITKNIKNSLESIKIMCRNSFCCECPFKTKDGGCMFFRGSPDDWEIPQVTDSAKEGTDEANKS